MEQVYGILTEEPSELETANRALARRAAAESFVLLKNDGALPLQTKKIALYGMGARKTVKGGLGSGSVNERYSVTVEEGLKNAGYEITTDAWLDDYDAEYNRTYAAWHDMVESKVAGLTNPVEIIPLAHSFVYRYPSGRKILPEDVEKSGTDTAIYVLMRQAGECNDRRLEAGDYLLTETERSHLRTLAESYAHTIFVINVGGGIDLGILDELSGIGAVVNFVQGGEEGGNALADVLSGKTNFSGKLADTIPMRYEDVPFGKEFSHLNGDLDNEYYREGIYVGYRYYDSFDVKVRYPFGFGLSYTDFSVEVTDVKLEKTKVNVTASVTNTGLKYAGREVLQLYLTAPAGRLVKEHQRLTAFVKTKELQPGEKERITAGFDLPQCASYDTERAAWVLEAGDYLLRAGNSSRNAKIVAVVTLGKEVVLVKAANRCVPTDDLGDFVPSEEVKNTLAERDEKELEEAGRVFRLEVKPEAFLTQTVDYAKPEETETPEEKALLDRFTTEELIEFLRGGDLQRVPEGAFEIYGASGKTTTALLNKGVRNIIMSDGPAGINITDKNKYMGNGKFAFASVPERYQWGVLKQYGAKMIPEGGRMVYRYATAWPVGMLLAQSWNPTLLEEIGRAVQKEMELFGITLWLAPGMNIHRNPLGGRNFEYYSEDPLVSGKMAAAITRGVQCVPGFGTVIKHFCCNDSEDNRNHSSSNLSERALREIHLKGFELAVKESQPKAVMSSYNMVNHVYTPNSHDLLTDILRCEWGFAGLVMTDWGSCNETAGKSRLCPAAGNDLIMPGAAEDATAILAAYRAGELPTETIRACALRVIRVLSEAKTPVFS